MDNSFPKINGKSILGSPFAFPDVWQTVAWNSSLLLLIPAILIITLISNEFTYKTHRQNVIDGLSRNQFINVKLLEVFLFSLFLTVVVFLTALGFGYLGNKILTNTSIWKDMRFSGFFFMEMISYSMIAFLITILVKRAGLSMGIFFIYMIIEQLVVAVLRNRYKMQWVDFMPQEVTDMLIPQPYARKILITPDKITSWENSVANYLIIACIYIFIYCILTNLKFRKSDI
jgi:ABC-type transport system involved in multi-copper enzyme maturation permease subunit